MTASAIQENEATFSSKPFGRRASQLSWPLPHKRVQRVGRQPGGHIDTGRTAPPQDARTAPGTSSLRRGHRVEHRAQHHGARERADDRGTEVAELQRAPGELEPDHQPHPKGQQHGEQQHRRVEPRHAETKAEQLEPSAAANGDARDEPGERQQQQVEDHPPPDTCGRRQDAARAVASECPTMTISIIRQ